MYVYIYFGSAGETDHPSSVYLDMEEFKSTLQVTRYHVTGLFDCVCCGYEVGDSDCAVMFGWICFGELIG